MRPPLPSDIAYLDERLAAELADPRSLPNTIAGHGAWSSGRRPSFFADREVRAFLVVCHRAITIDLARAEVSRRFGKDRCPSRSAVQRFWAVLDKVRARSTRRAA